MLGLPAGVDACLFDLDGLLTQTARVHADVLASDLSELLDER